MIHGRNKHDNLMAAESIHPNQFQQKI